MTTEPGLSQGVSHDHAPAACPRAWPPAASPLWWCVGGWAEGETSHIRRAGEEAPARTKECPVRPSWAPPRQLSTVSGHYLWALMLLSMHADADSWQADLFLLLRVKGWVMACCCCCCSTFVMRLLGFFSIFLFDLGSKFLASKKQIYDAMLFAAVKL